MSGSRTWNLKRSDLSKDPNTGRLHNATKFKELGEMIDNATDRAQSSYRELANRMCRKILEEVANIVQHNKTWNDLSVKTDINSTKTTFKITIKYDGSGYYDPSRLKHVVDGEKWFAVYEREKPIVENDGTVIIKFRVAFKAEDEDELI